MNALLKTLLGNLALDSLGDTAIEQASDAITSDYGKECDAWYAEALEKDKPHPGRYVVRQFIREVLGKLVP